MLLDWLCLRLIWGTEILFFGLLSNSRSLLLCLIMLDWIGLSFSRGSGDLLLGLIILFLSLSLGNIILSLLRLSITGHCLLLGLISPSQSLSAKQNSQCTDYF
jgi:hypothetical protein